MIYLVRIQGNGKKAIGVICSTACVQKMLKTDATEQQIVEELTKNPFAINEDRSQSEWKVVDESKLKGNRGTIRPTCIVCDKQFEMLKADEEERK